MSDSLDRVKNLVSKRADPRLVAFAYLCSTLHGDTDRVLKIIDDFGDKVSMILDHDLANVDDRRVLEIWTRGHPYIDEVSARITELYEGRAVDPSAADMKVEAMLPVLTAAASVHLAPWKDPVIVQMHNAVRSYIYS